MLARSTVLARQGNFRAVSGGGLPQDWMYWCCWSFSCCFCLTSSKFGRSVL